MKRNCIKTSDLLDLTKNNNNANVFEFYLDIKNNVFERNSISKGKHFLYQSLHYTIIYIEKGKGEVNIDDNVYPIGSNSLFVLTPGQLYSLNNIKNIKAYRIDFSEKILLEIDQPFVYKLHFDILHRYNRITIHTEESTIQEYFKLIHQEFNHKMDYINKNLLRQLLICILYKIEKLLTHTFTYQKNETLEIQFKKMVDLHFKEWHHLHNYLQQLNTSRKHIDKIIFQKYKKRPTDLIDEKLINQSKMLLQYSEHSIKHISIYLGFTDVSNYCKFFKIHTGVTPNEYRRLVIQEGLFSLSHNR